MQLGRPPPVTFASSSNLELELSIVTDGLLSSIYFPSLVCEVIYIRDYRILQLEYKLYNHCEHILKVHNSFPKQWLCSPYFDGQAFTKMVQDF